MKFKFGILSSVIFATLLTGFSFSEKWARYPRPDEILMLFQDRFSDGFANSAVEIESCRHLTSENRFFLGDNRPADGKPIVAEPNLHFAKWYAGCLADAIGNEVAFLLRNQRQVQPGTVDSKILDWIPLPSEPALLREMLGLIQATAPVPRRDPTASTPEISPELRLHIITHVVVRLIGPDRVLSEKAPLFNAQTLRNHILLSIDALDFSERGFQSMGFNTLLWQNESSIYGYLAATMLVVGLQDEFLMQ